MNSRPGPAVVSWSGGKDSCLALHLAVEAGFDVRAAIAMFDEHGERSRSHALPREVIAAQADALGLSLDARPTTWARYEADFVAALAAQRATGVEHAVFGDIDLLPHREWEEKACAAAGLVAQLPLWHWPRAQVVDAVFARGIEATVVCVNERFLPREFCGVPYDRAFIARLPEGVDACGENGEFHTCVTAAPLLRRRLPLVVRAVEPYQAPAEYGGERFWFAHVVLQEML